MDLREFLLSEIAKDEAEVEKARRMGGVLQLRLAAAWDEGHAAALRGVTANPYA